MDRKPSDGIDEGALTAGQRRKLRALRKSVGDEIGERAFAEWLASRGAAEPKADANAALIVNSALAPGRARRAGDSARRLPHQARSWPHHCRGGAALERRCRGLRRGTTAL